MTERGGLGSRTTTRNPLLDGYMIYTPVLVQEYIKELEVRCVRAEEALRAFFAEYDDESVWIDCPSDETEQKMRDALAGVDKPA